MVTGQRNYRGKTGPVEAIIDIQGIEKIKQLLSDQPRNLALFLMGINCNLRSSDLLKIQIGKLRGVKPGGYFQIREKTGNTRKVYVHEGMHRAITTLLDTLSEHPDDAPLFQSRKGGGQLTAVQLNRLVKQWCASAGLKGQYGAMSLHKTWAYTLYMHHGAELKSLSRGLGHNGKTTTLRFLGLTERNVTDLPVVEI